MHLMIPLFRKVFGRKVSMAELAAKYNTKQLHPGYFGHFAFDGTTAVAFVGAIPTLLEYQEKCELTAHFGDGMILPAHRNWVLFSKILQLNYDQLKDAGFTAGWTNTSSRSEVLFTSRFKWTPVHRLNAYTVNVSDKYSAFVKRTFFSKKDGSMPGAFTKVVSERTSFHSFEGGDIVKVHRDSAFHEYKKNRGDFFITIAGCRLWLKQKGTLFIGDIDLAADTAISDVLPELKKLAARAGAPRILFQTSPGSEADRQFAALMDPFPSWKLGFINFNSQLPLHKLHCTQGDFDTF